MPLVLTTPSLHKPSPSTAAARSFDPDGTITNYAWNFGDGGSGSGATPTHSYAAAGTYTATLTVTDNMGATNSATAAVTVYASVADEYTQNFYQWALPIN